MKPKSQPTRVHILEDLVEVLPYDPKLYEQVSRMEHQLKKQVEAAKENYLGVMAEEELARAENIKSPGAYLPLIEAALEGYPYTDGSLLYDRRDDDDEEED